MGTENAIETSQLCKAFDGNRAVDAVDIVVPTGSVYALLGRNGAGKSTAMRMLLGLLTPDEGSIRVLGQSMPTNRQTVLAQVGSSIESPALYANLTARENLRINAALLGLGEREITRALNTAGLADTRKVVGHYSLGMRQRLAMALALLGEPPLLILDEPTNGLDPVGIVELREQIRSLPDYMDTTVLVSTHMLSEAEQMATHIGMIERGRLCCQGHRDDLIEPASTVSLRVSDTRQAALLVNAEITDEPGGWVRAIASNDADVARVCERLIQSGVQLFEMERARNSLESFFLSHIESDREVAA